MTKYTVILASVGNPDFGQDQCEPVCGVFNKVIPVNTLEEASIKCRNYVEANVLGSGNWAGGQIYEDKTQVAYVSYNGRICPVGSENFKTFDYGLGFDSTYTPPMANVGTGLLSKCYVLNVKCSDRMLIKLNGEHKGKVVCICGDGCYIEDNDCTRLRNQG